jgi:hypothetical protein
MRKLIESTLVSLDGVIESPYRWALFDQEAAGASLRELDKYDAFVFGRAGYEELRSVWEPIRDSPYIDAINAMPKYVAHGRCPRSAGTPPCSATTQSASWGG